MELYINIAMIVVILLAILLVAKLVKYAKSTALVVVSTVLTLIIRCLYYIGAYLLNVEPVVLNLTNLLSLALAYLLCFVFGISLTILTIFPPDEYGRYYE